MKLKPHWQHAILTFALTLLAAGVLLPLVRTQPESVHQYFNGLNNWLRICFILFLCLVFTGSMFKLLSPRLRHLAHLRSHPPAWLASLLAWIVVAVVDVYGGFAPDGYRATAWEWLGYGVGSLLLVGWYTGMCSELYQWSRKKQIEEDETVGGITIQDIENAPWEEIEAWLKSDEPAQCDFLGNHSVAERITSLIAKGTRSVGLVGPYGAGKTSIIKWICDRLEKREHKGRKFFVCQHSCWGFETSASAIQDMLKSAISKLSQEIDTFQVDSLPESYRKTFSAGGNWVETISNLILLSPNPMGQFSRLNILLGDIGSRLVIIVEDLDRNETSNFEIQEVLAFLERLKEYPNISFILTGGISTSHRIDYAKLCDHIELLRTIQPQQSSALIKLVRQRCLDQSVFKFISLESGSDNTQWNPLSSYLLRDDEEFLFPQAIATLLNTPRSLRHALGQTFSAWKILYGEIAFNQLLAVNVLRYGAPECFQFLIRRWDRLNYNPTQETNREKETLEAIRQAVLDDWNRTIQNVEWKHAAAIKVMESILPASKYWLLKAKNEASNSGYQVVSKERYWVRAINEVIDGDIHDQEVIYDIQAWMDTPGIETKLITRLTTSAQYASIWEELAVGFFANRRDKILLLCEQVIQRIVREQGYAASADSQGFIHTWRYCINRVGYHNENSSWLQSRISKTVRVSLQMATDIWYYYASPMKSFIHYEERLQIRLHMLDAVRADVTDSESLISRLSTSSPATLFRLVFDPRTNDGGILADVQTWAWLGPIILDGLRRGDIAVAANCGVLLHARNSAYEQVTCNTEVLEQFFGDSAPEVIKILESMIDQIPQNDQPIVRNVVSAARIHLGGGTLTVTEESQTDFDKLYDRIQNDSSADNLPTIELDHPQPVLDQEGD